ncbi:MAG: hypothetical protein R3E32_03845 [Chitinophagales bacterium]
MLTANDIAEFIDHASVILQQEYDKGNENAIQLDELIGDLVDKIGVPDDTEVDVALLPFNVLLDVCNNLLYEDRAILEKMEFTLQKLKREGKDTNNYRQKIAQHQQRLTAYGELLQRLQNLTVRAALQASEASEREARIRNKHPRSWGFHLRIELHNEQPKVRYWIL